MADKNNNPNEQESQESQFTTLRAYHDTRRCLNQIKRDFNAKLKPFSLDTPGMLDIIVRDFQERLKEGDIEVKIPLMEE